MHPPMKRCLPSGKSKDSSKVSATVRSQSDSLANRPTPGQFTNSWLCPVFLGVTTCRPVALNSWPTAPEETLIH